MRVFAILITALMLECGPASAQSWMDYDYPDAGFAIHFPATPTVTNGLYETSAGAFLGARIYSLQVPGNLYSVTVADLSGTNTDHDGAVAQAVETVHSQGYVQVDIPARVNGQRGRQLSIVGNDGSHSNLAIFVANNHLFQIEGTVLPSNPDLQSGDAIRFQQSLRFTGDYAGRRFAQGPGGNRGPRGRFGGRRVRPGADAPADVPPRETQPQQMPSQGQ